MKEPNKTIQLKFKLYGFSYYNSSLGWFFKKDKSPKTYTVLKIRDTDILPIPILEATAPNVPTIKLIESNRRRETNLTYFINLNTALQYIIENDI